MKKLEKDTYEVFTNTSLKDYSELGQLPGYFTQKKDADFLLAHELLIDKYFICG
ncbi:MAG: hypothetical protein JW731_06150 [Bacteroidales bacterium]|nr:hypothetical protein [Bacteroidales bacterium]